jgi:hypothetical protein
MIDARQNPLFLKNKRRSAESQVSGSPLKTWVTWARAPSYCATCLTTVVRGKVNVAAINPIRYPNCCNCRLLFPLNHQLHLTEAHTTSFFNTSPQILCSSHGRPWQPISAPTILTRIPLGWMGSSSKKGAGATVGAAGRRRGTSSPQVRMPQPC